VAVVGWQCRMALEKARDGGCNGGNISGIGEVLSEIHEIKCDTQFFEK
jgi:hypothetical protein